jgi:leucyl aminopeptidase (aminopeptidase T)
MRTCQLSTGSLDVWGLGHGRKSLYRLPNNLAEFAIATNPKARLVDKMQEAKKGMGTIHFALGDNITLGGDTSSKTRLDGLILNPTVFLDGDRVIEDRKLSEVKFLEG